MRPKRAVAAIAAAVALAWGSAQAAPETEGMVEVPGVIILEVQPPGPGEAPVAGTDQEQALMALLLLQLLGAMQGPENVGGNVESVQPIAPPVGTRI